MATKRTQIGIVPRDNSIKIWFMYQGKRCWESIKLNPTPPNIRYAAKLRDEICNKIALGCFSYAEYFPESKRAANDASKAKTFEMVANDWIETIGDLATSTIEGYLKMLNNHVLPKIGSMPIDKITYSRLASLLTKLDCGAKTKNNVATVIRQPFMLAVRDGLIKDNPAQYLQNAKAQKEPPDPFMLDEAELILAKLKGEPVYYNYFELAFFTGLRTSELFALTWQDIDFNRQTMRINKASVKGEIKSTKTYSFRDVELNSRAIEALHRQRMITGLLNGNVFLDPKTKRPFTNTKTPWRPWQYAVMLSGVRYRKPYNTRHTYATMNLMAGANPMWVARQMGHTTMKMLLENYSRWIDLADKQREKLKIEQLINPKCAKSVPADKVNSL